MAAFDPFLSSRPLAETLRRSPPGQKLIVDHHYYTFSSIFYTTNRTALLLNGRFNNLVYGSYAPGLRTAYSSVKRAMENVVASTGAVLSPVITREAAAREEPGRTNAVNRRRQRSAGAGSPSSAAERLACRRDDASRSR